MTKKDYELIAEGIQDHRKQYGGRTDSVVKEVVYSLAMKLEQENDRFNAEKFTQACMSGEVER
jgi:hypothetical protein